MTAPTAAPGADRALKDKHRAMWALGDYPALAADIIPGLGQILAEPARSGPETGCWT